MNTPASRRARRPVLTATLAAVLALAVLPASEALQPAQSRVVSADPVNWTPHVMDGQVNAVVQVGDTAIVGGTFTQVRTAGSGTNVTRNYLFAVDTTTGALDPDFVATVDGVVEDIAVDGSAVVIAGGFTTVNGVTKRRLARIDAGTGALATGFTAHANALVQEVAVRGGRLYAGGKFTTVNSSNRSGLARLDAATGAVDPGFDLPLTEPPRGTLGVQGLDVTANGSTLAVVGNFGRVAGQERVQAALLDVGGATASVANWQTSLFPVWNPDVANATWCSSTFESWVRDVEFSPDGAYFVVATSGANRAGRLCDSVSRWETSARGTGLQPTWVDWSGGDSLTAVAVTGEAVYVGGHQRWMNNPYIALACGDCPGPGPGGVPRDGIAALDPLNGLPYSWNPGRARGYGVNAFFATANGLWVGSDTDVLGGETHRKLGFFPLAGGVDVPADQPYPITADLYDLDSATGTMMRRPYATSAMGAGTAVPTGVDWRGARGAFVVGDRLYTGWSDGTFRVRDFDGTSVGPPAGVDLHNLEVAPPTSFKIPGTRTAIPSLTTHLAKATGMFFHEGRLYYTVTNDARLYYRYFTPESGVVGANLFVASTGDGVPWAKVRGMTMGSGQLVYATADGKLWRIGFNGRPTGTATLIGGQRVDGVDWASTGLFSYSP